MSEWSLFLEHVICMLIMTLILRRHYLTTPPVKRRGRLYGIQIETCVTIQYAHGLPYRTCVIAQPRHPGDMRLSGLEVLSLLLLATECYENAPNERFYTVPTMILR